MSKHIISPSLLSANFLNLEADLEKINQSEADWGFLSIFVNYIIWGRMDSVST